MLLDFGDGEPRVDVSYEDALEQVLRLGRNELGDGEVAGEDLLVQQ